MTLHGRVVRKSFGEQGTFEGTIKSLGSRSRPYAFAVEYEDGDRENMKLEEVKALIQIRGGQGVDSNSSKRKGKGGRWSHCQWSDNDEAEERLGESYTNRL